MKVLILSYRQDLHARVIARILKKRGVETVLFNPSQFPSNSASCFSIQQAGYDFEIEISGKRHALNSFTAIWSRHPDPPLSLAEDQGVKKYIEIESRVFLSNLWPFTKDAFWLSPLPNLGIAECKPYQLKLAREVGLLIPETCIGNDPEVAKTMSGRWERVALKAVHAIRLNLDLTLFEKGKAAFYNFKNRKWIQRYQNDPFMMSRIRYIKTVNFPTKLLSLAELPKTFETLPACPVILQEYIPKAFELRITVVGRKIFSCAIYSQEVEENKVDWRHDIFANRHEVYELPLEIQDKCFALLKQLGLQFGCIDMVVTPDGDYVFLEVNAVGQWLWVEKLTGMPIAEAVADLLINRDGL